jgi:gamma-glutamyltranspeptidase/glutathione hydrolase
MFSRTGSTRSAARGARGDGTTRHSVYEPPLASQAAVETLRAGGNAVDAAVCAAAALGVVEPFMTASASDCFMLIWHPGDQQLYGLNGSGRAPRAETREAMLERGHTTMPMHGLLSVTVPGAVDAWSEALTRFGRRRSARPSHQRFEYATSGFPVSEIIATQWSFAASLLQNDGRTPRVHRRRAARRDWGRSSACRAGRQPAHAGRREARRLLPRRAGAGHRRLLARQRRTARRGDLAAHESTWVEPISTDYRGVECASCRRTARGSRP